MQLCSVCYQAKQIHTPLYINNLKTQTNTKQSKQTKNNLHKLIELNLNPKNRILPIPCKIRNVISCTNQNSTINYSNLHTL